MNSLGSSLSVASSSGSSHPHFTLPLNLLISSSSTQTISTSAGASPISPSLSPSSKLPLPQAHSPPRFVSALRPPSPPPHEINEKVRNALEDAAVLPMDTQHSVQSHTRARSRSRDCSRGRQLERTMDGRDWDEKRALTMRYGDQSSVSGPSHARPLVPPRQARPGMIQGPVRSSSLSSASFARPPLFSSVSESSSQAPPPYSTVSSFSPASSSSYHYSSYSSSVRRMLLIERVRPWVPFLLYVATTLGFVLAIAFWREEVFGGLDDLAQWLREEEKTGYAVMFFMVFLTCIPPIPLYSTLQILSGYTFGAWTGCIISYFAALAGALFVFALSRSVPSLRGAITTCMSHSRPLQRVVRAISRRPSLLFLVRLAPYPYNVLNALLAGCPRLTFRTYTACTALSLLKVISDSSKNNSGLDESEEENSNFLSQASTIAGIVLCLALAVYLSVVARRAVDEELEDDDDVECGRARPRARGCNEYGVRADEEERAAFLDDTSGGGLGADFAAAEPPAFASASGQGMTPPGRVTNGEMVERDDSVRLDADSPVPLSSLSATPYGPPEWTRC
ncbi:hypothetical protein EW145_g5031 [Phellinidium pouzarii]|uniref:Golgi apparatus membrane protein TVP38 n=1 Tax=Phellinidium pouzarii TaxID=167371 RepID=A0A4S4L1E0_9AGAM|nr:hypothetical protein EW145_g5031 [Phellinidium pouzarii]